MEPITFRNSSLLVRRGKHVVDLGCLLPSFRSGTKAPSQFTTVQELLSECPDRVKNIDVASSASWPALEYHYIGDESAYQREWPARACPRTSILEIESGRVFGRSCFPIGPNGKALGEFAFNFDQKIAQSMRFGKWNPKYRRYRQRGDITARRRLPIVQQFEGTVAALNLYASHNYYHWMIDILPRIEALHRAGIRPDRYLLDCYKPFQIQTLEAIGVTADRVIQPHDGLLLQPTKLYVITRDNPDGRRRVGPWLSKALHTRIPATTDSKAPRRIFIRRGKRTSRRIRNQDQVEAALAKRGFESFELEGLRLAEQARLFARADIVVALHGAGLSNAIFAPSHTSIIELMPRGRVNFSYPLLSQSLGHRHWVITIERVGSRQGVVAPVELLGAVIDRMPPRNDETCYRRAS